MSTGKKIGRPRKTPLQTINNDSKIEFFESEDSIVDKENDIDEPMEIETPKRRGRPSKANTPAKQSTAMSKTPKKSIVLPEIEASDEENIEMEEIIEKPSEVLFEEQDISGKTMFGFQKIKKKGTMIQRASEIINQHSTPTNSNTKTTQNTPNTTNTSTPYTFRNKKGQNFTHFDQDSTDEDFSPCQSDFEPSHSSSSEAENDSESDASNDDDDNSSDDGTNQVKKHPGIPKNIPNPSSSRNINKDQTYIMKSDDYFSWQASSKIITSNHTLQKLKNPKLSEDELQQLLMSCNLNQSAIHEKLIHDMFKSNCCNFNKWIYIIHEGFNILLYGLGSKRNILRTFQKEMLQSSPVVVVNGYFPSLTIKDITDSILVDIFEETNAPANVYEAVDLIRDYCTRLKTIDVYLIVHNIDGPMLRNNKSQNILASLADITNIHLLASIDHINTPLIWDHSKLSKFNFTWWDVTSFLPYSDETSFESSMLVQRSGALALSSLANVYQSLTKNSKGIFMLIVKYQLKNKSVKYYQGMPFKVLYSQCRENFLVSSDLALRTQLTEFLDHKLVKSKRAVDGVEQLNIPINNSLLQQFIEQNS